MQQQKIFMDPFLLGAVKAALGHLPYIPYDLKKIKTLDNFYSPVSSYIENVGERFVVKTGEFAAMGQMEQLRRLSIFRGNYEPFDMGDFSFLPQCQNLQHLDLRYTNFTDCSLLLALPRLKIVCLPPKETLTQTEALQQLPATVKVSFLGQMPPKKPVPVFAPPQPKKCRQSSKQVEALAAEIKRRTATTCWELTIQPGEQPGLLDSKIGGLPYWEPNLEYPTDQKGEKMALLAQVNFSQLGTEPPLPTHGLLQFFLSLQDDLFGMDFDHPTKQQNYRIIYHAQPNPSITREQVEALHIPTHQDGEYFPVLREALLTGEKCTAYMGPYDSHFDAIYQDITTKLMGRAQNLFDLSDDDYEAFEQQVTGSGHRLLGYPYFTQYDPRPVDSPYDTLLFQLDSDMGDGSDYVLWGDCGVANFFINREDLQRCDFRHVLYNWDCC